MDVIDPSNTDNDIEFEIGVLCEHSERRQKQTNAHFAYSLQRKLPERIDILNEANQREFIKKMSNSVLSQLDLEKSILSDYYGSEEIQVMLNSKYNYVMTKDNLDMGRLTVDDVRDFNNTVLFSRWDFDIENVYREFTTATKQVLDNKSANVSNILDRAAVMLLCTTLSRRNNQLYGMTNQDTDYVFSLKNFLVTLILLSTMTVNQKLDILYEIFDWEDGERDGLDITAVQMLANTVLYRNLQFVPSNQINNMVELHYQSSASFITS